MDADDQDYDGAGDLPLDAMPPLPGYTLVAELGRGGQGVVFRGIQQSLKREVAIKVLHPRFLSDHHIRARFKKEAQLLASLSHENVVAIIDRGTQGAIGFLVMELIDGETLADELGRGTPSRRRALEVLAQVAAGLDYCHERALVIRDLKPSNLLVNRRGIVKIADFGLAKIVASSGYDTETELSRSGQTVGTPRYMSPEQAAAKDLDHRTDLYSFGLIAYEMLTGPLPLHHLPPASERAPDLPRGVDRVIQRMLDPLPENRHQSAQAFLDALREALAPSGEPHPAGHAATTAGKLSTLPRPRSSRDLAVAAVASLALGAVVAAAVAPRPAPLPAPVAARATDTGARFTLPGPWWLGAQGDRVLALATDELTGATWLARFGPEAARGVPPVVERFPLDPVAAAVAGGALVVRTRDGQVKQVDLAPGLAVKGEAVFPPATSAWAWNGWNRELTGPQRWNVADGLPGPLATSESHAVVPASGGLAVVDLATGAARRVPFAGSVSALLMRPGELWAATRHGDSVALIRERR